MLCACPRAMKCDCAIATMRCARFIAQFTPESCQCGTVCIPFATPLVWLFSRDEKCNIHVVVVANSSYLWFMRWWWKMNCGRMMTTIGSPLCADDECKIHRCKGFNELVNCYKVNQCNFSSKREYRNIASMSFCKTWSNSAECMTDIS